MTTHCILSFRAESIRIHTTWDRKGAPATILDHFAAHAVTREFSLETGEGALRLGVPVFAVRLGLLIPGDMLLFAWLLEFQTGRLQLLFAATL